MKKKLPNLLTVMRLVLATAFFIVLNQYRYDMTRDLFHTLVLLLAIGTFILAAATDWLDGYLARKWKAESQFGRIMDPFCDKILVIGAFIFLAGPRFIIPDKAPNPLFSLNMITGVYPWMVVVILARELLVTAIRGEMEGHGAKFGANVFGKAKMILQSIAVPVILLVVWIGPEQHRWAATVRDIFVYTVVVVTVASGWPYIIAAKRSMTHGPP